MDVRLVTRGQSSLREPRKLVLLSKPVGYIFIHHTASKRSDNPLKDWSEIQGYHMNTKGWADIAYTWGASVDRRNGASQPVALEGRQLDGKAVVGAHTLGWNDRSIAVCAIGNFQGDEADNLLIEAVKGAIELAKQRGQVVANPVIWSHSKVFATACAGHNLIVRIPELYKDAPAIEVPTLPVPAKPAISAYPGFPLPSGHWFGVVSSNPRNHSGFWAEDRPNIWRLTEELSRRGWRIPVTDRYTVEVERVVKKFQGEKRLTIDGATGAITHKAIWEAPIT